MAIRHAVAVRPERTLGEVDISDKEKFLLRALLNLLLYVGGDDDVLGDMKDMLFKPGPNTISPKIRIS